MAISEALNAAMTPLTMTMRPRRYSAGDARPDHTQRAAPTENDLFELHEDQHGYDRCERCRTPQPLLHERWELRVPGYKMECAERSSGKTRNRPEDLGAIHFGVLLCDHDLFGRGFERLRQAR